MISGHGDRAGLMEYLLSDAKGIKATMKFVEETGRFRREVDQRFMNPFGRIQHTYATASNGYQNTGNTSSLFCPTLGQAEERKDR